MQHKQGLVPIWEAFGDLDGPVKAIREATPQAVHHFTQADQVNQLVLASEANPDLGFMARTMALCSLPRGPGSDPMPLSKSRLSVLLLTARNPGNPRPCTPVPVQSRG